jgi:hypothetical protein
MVEVEVKKSNRETIEKYESMLKDLTDKLNGEIGSNGNVRLRKEMRDYGWGYLIEQKSGWLFSRDLAVFEPVGRPEFGYAEDHPVNIDVRVYTPEVLETVKRVVSEYAGKPESNVTKVNISLQF